MKVKTQLLLTMILFGLLLLVSAASLWVTYRQTERLNQQQGVARDIERTARELSYLSNDYLLHGEDQQRARWQTRYNTLSTDLDRLVLEDPGQQLLVNQMQASKDRLLAVFSDVADDIENAARFTGGDELPFLQVSWSRLEVQNQTIIFNASMLSQKLLDEEDQLRYTNTFLIGVLSLIFGAYLITNYFLIYRRTLGSLANLQEGVRTLSAGDLSSAIQDQQKDEFGELARAFNRMTANLRQITASKADLEREMAERQLAEEALRHSEMRLRRLVDANIIGVLTWDGAGQVMNANEAFLSLIGATMEDVQKRQLNILDLVPAEERGREMQLRKNGSSTDSCKPCEQVFLRQDGRRVPVLVGKTQIDEGPETEWIGFVLDLTGLKQAQAALTEYTEKLKRSNQELEQFALVASHDLQEPLRKIRGFGGMLKQHLGDGPDAKTGDYLSRMESAAERMQRMIDDLLELSRVSRRGERFIQVALSEVAAEVLSDLEPRIQASGGQVLVDTLPPIEADPLQIRQLLQNLIGNAIKYHKPDVPPLVKVWCQDCTEKWANSTMVTICIQDNGIGFSEQYAERIFQPFTRLHGRTEYEGTGMGLAICKKIVERHHGKITAHSRPGEGSTFLVSLPLKQFDAA